MRKSDHLFSKFYLVLFLLFLVSVPILAYSTNGISVPLPNPLRPECGSWPDCIGLIAKWIYYIALALAVIMFIWAGVLFMTSGGNEQQITKAKQAFLWAVVGLGLALMYWGLVYLIKDILSVRG